MITSDDLSKTVYTVGGYFEADGKEPAPFDNSGIRSSNTPITSSGEEIDPNSDVDKHFFIQGSNPLSFRLEEVEPRNRNDVRVCKLKFLPAGATDNIVYYLPYFQKNITSTILPTDDQSDCCFITDGLSGCNFFIDKLPDGRLVCYHANADPKADNVQDTMDKQHRTAREDLHRAENVTSERLENVASLRVAEYYAKPQESIDRKVGMGRTNVRFTGGTTVMGFRVAGQWKFWYQTYSRLSYERPGMAAAFLGKQVNDGDLPLEIVDFGPVWPK